MVEPEDKLTEDDFKKFEADNKESLDLIKDAMDGKWLDDLAFASEDTSTPDDNE